VLYISNRKRFIDDIGDYIHRKLIENLEKIAYIDILKQKNS